MSSKHNKENYWFIRKCGSTSYVFRLYKMDDFEYRQWRKI